MKLHKWIQNLVSFFTLYGDCDCDCAAPPNYDAVAQASKESAEVMAALGRDQIAESKRQYDLNKQTADKVSASQLALMDQTKQQGDEYFNYWKTNAKPVESILQSEALGLTVDEQKQLADLRAAETAAYNKALEGYKPQDTTHSVEYDVPTYSLGWEDGAVLGKTIPDVQGIPALFGNPGSPGINYDDGTYYVKDAKGQYVPAKQKLVTGTEKKTLTVPGQTGQSAPNFQMDTSASDKFLAERAAAASARKEEEAAGRAVADVRQGTTQQQNQMMRQGMRYGFSPSKMASVSGILATQQGLAGASAANQAREKEKSLGYAKKLDVAGLYRGMPSASQGAYSVANNSGNSAVANAMAPGAQLINGMNAGANVVGAGQNLRMQGVLGVLNAQSSYANSTNQAMASGGGGGGLGGIGSILGGGAQLYSAMSDRRVKENIKLHGVDENTGLNLYEFSYIGNDKRYIGVMADEVEKSYPDAVTRDDDGYASVNYGMLGIEMVEV